MGGQLSVLAKRLSMAQEEVRRLLDPHYASPKLSRRLGDTTLRLGNVLTGYGLVATWTSLDFQMSYAPAKSSP